MKKYKILHLEDVLSDAELAIHELKKSLDFEHLLVDGKEEFIQALHSFKPDIILCDHSLPSFNSFQALTILKEYKLNIPFIIITATMSEEVANEVVHMGADDYILKDRLKRLPVAVQNALERSNFENEKRELLSVVQEKEISSKKELQQLSTTLQLATSIARIGVWEYYFQTDHLIWDDAMIMIFGLKKTDLIVGYRSFEKCIHPDDRPFFARHMKDALESENSLTVEFRIIRSSDGQIRHLKSQAAIFNDDLDRGTRLLGTITDVTETILSARKVEESFQLLQDAYHQQATLIDSLESHIALLDGNGDIISVNQAWKDFANDNQLSHQNYFVNENYFDICSRVKGKDKAVAAAVAGAIRQVLTGATTSFTTEYSCHSPSEERWFKVTVTPLFNNHSNGAVVSHSNITERKINEQLLLTQNKALIKANAELDRFVYSASHELRSPLAAVLGLTNIGKSADTQELSLEMFDLIEQSVTGLDHFIKDIITYSRNGRTEVESELIDFHEILSYSISQLKYLNEAQDINISFNIDGNTPFYSDPKRLLVIVNNLLSNSLKYRKPGHSRSFVKISVRTSTRHLKLDVIDNGIGISAESIDRIFDMFYRATNASTGSGLGLYILTEIVDKLAGSVKVKSTEGKGTRITVQIPNSRKH